MGGLTATQRLVEDKTPGRIVIHRIHLRAMLCPVVGDDLMQLGKELPRKVIRPYDESLRGLRERQDQYPTINARGRGDDAHGQLVCADKGRRADACHVLAHICD